MKRGDLIWLSFHVVGLGYAALTNTPASWTNYFVAYALLELLGLWRGWPFTSSARRFLAGQEGAGGFWRPVVVVAHTAILVSSFWLFAPAPDGVKGVVGLVAGVWMIGHFLGRRW